jgi:phosphatidylglycerol lysyltransferase
VTDADAPVNFAGGNRLRWRVVDEPPARARALALLKQHGWNATSFQMLEPGFRYWFDGDACVGYVDTGAAWIAAGAPVSADEALAPAATHFVEAARAAGRRAVFFATEERFAHHPALPALASLRIGEQPVWDPSAWTTTVRATRSLREQLRRARAKGVTVRALAAAELADAGGATRRAIDTLIARWSQAHPMPPMGFLVAVHAYEQLDERRCFVAERSGHVLGFLAAVPVYARGGWLFEDLLRDPAAPNGTAELLIEAAMTAAAAEGSRYVTLGLVPLAGPLPPWLRLARRSGGGLYDFEGLRAFKAKLRPASWVSIYLSFPAGQGVAPSVRDVLTAFARGGLLRFGVATLVRAPAVLVQLLALLLVPWTALLALADTARWFPSRGVQAGWVLFDLALAAALARLGRRWRAGLDVALAALVSVDAALTAFEVAWINLRRGPPSLGDAAVWLVAIVGPTLASVAMWRGVAKDLRRRRGR